jgi:hypothetical protein
VVASLVSQYLPHLEFTPEQMKMLPKAVFDDAKALFNKRQP